MGEQSTEFIMTDSYGRKITDVRLMVNKACNLRCIYCHKEGDSPQNQDNNPLTVSEIKELTEIFGELGVQTIKISGGEPLLRSDIVEVIRAIPSSIEVSLTTNGVLLASLAKELKDAGLSRVNISIDSLKQERYAQITGKNLLPEVIRGVDLACSVGLTPVKINIVLLPGMNDDEIDDFIAFASSRKDVILQFIELINLNGCADNIPSAHDTKRSLIRNLEERFEKESDNIVIRKMQKRIQYHIRGVTVELVHPYKNPEFCANCNRIRITSDGKIKPCLFSEDKEVSLHGLHGTDLKLAIATAIATRKPYFHD